MNGLLLIDKPAGMTSFDVIAILRKKLRISKIGHTGTLDPNATGLLMVLVGNATKLVPYLEYANKTYEASFQFGLSSDTEDIWGHCEQHPYSAFPDSSALEQSMRDLTGEILQIPPMVSAIKVNGKKLYEYARKGEVIERKPRLVQISEFSLRSIHEPEIDVCITCSKGTYIRSLARDLGESLHIPCVVSQLRRTRIGSFNVEEAYKLDDLPDDVAAIHWINPVNALPREKLVEWPDPKEIINGKRIWVDSSLPQIFLTHRGELLACYGKRADGYYYCQRGLL